MFLLRISVVMRFINQFWQKQLQIQAEQERCYEQSQAIVEWMYLVLLADQQIGLAGLDYVRARLSELPWRPNLSMDAYVSQTVAKTREALQHRGMVADLVVAMVDRMRSLELQDVAREHLEMIMRGKGRSESWILGELEKSL
jgi:hypothetical protein